MNKKSKVTNVQSNGTWDGQYGTMYKFEIEFENGDAGEYSSKSKDQTKFLAGVETDYEYTDGKFPKVKPVWVQNQQPVQSKPSAPAASDKMSKQDWANKDEAKEISIVRQSSLKAAVEFCDKNCTIEHIIDNAEVFYNWVRTGEKPKATKDEMPF